jgi:hypothetical protein
VNAAFLHESCLYIVCTIAVSPSRCPLGGIHLVLGVQMHDFGVGGYGSNWVGLIVVRATGGAEGLEFGRGRCAERRGLAEVWVL